MEYWQFKVPIKTWKYQDENEYLNLKKGSIYFQYFNRTKGKPIKNIGDIVFMYNTRQYATKAFPQGIYLVCKIISDLEVDKIKLEVIKDLRNNIKEPKNYGFEKIMQEIHDLAHQGTYYKFKNIDNPQKLYHVMINDEIDNLFPEELNKHESKILIEGAKKEIIVNSYERNLKARQECINKYGINCNVCNFNFEEYYGEIGQEFIHVHHLVEISSIKKSYKVNPIEDLRPVCPNCHAMLHKKKPAYSINELKIIMSKKVII